MRRTARRGAWVAPAHAATPSVRAADGPSAERRSAGHAAADHDTTVLAAPERAAVAGGITAAGQRLADAAVGLASAAFAPAAASTAAAAWAA